MISIIQENRIDDKCFTFILQLVVLLIDRRNIEQIQTGLRIDYRMDIIQYQEDESKYDCSFMNNRTRRVRTTMSDRREDEDKTKDDRLRIES